MTDESENKEPIGVKVDLTPEKKEKLKEAGVAVYTALKEHTDNPVEAMMVLHFLMDYLEEMVGAKYGGTLIVDKKPGEA